MKFRILIASLLCGAVILALSGAAAEKISFTKYHTPDEVSAILRSLASAYPQLARLTPIGKSAGKQEIFVLQIAGQPKGSQNPDARAAVFVSANLEGGHLIGTEAALLLCEKLLTSYGSDKATTSLLDSKTIYVAPLLNPDAAASFFATVKAESFRNARPVDEDLDMQADEDGPDDLNRDGLITQMRVKDPEGKWVPDPREPRLMKTADPKKGEKGLYAVYTEGLDNDGDGEYNEDPAGGVELNRNLPHDFEHQLKSVGLYPVSEAETIALVGFLTSHQTIALILNFSTENTILNLQQTGQAKAAADKVKVPRMFASFLGLEPDQEYTLKEIVDAFKGTSMGAGMEITEDMVAMFLGMGAAVAIDRQDLPVIEAVQKEYKDALKEAKLDYPESRAKGVGKGSFAAYAYFQYGVPVYSVDLWAVPEPKKEPAKDAITPEKLKSMSAEEFLALGEDKINAFLKEQGAPPNFNAEMLIKMVKSGQVNPQRMAEMMEKMPKRPQAQGDEHPEAYVLKWADAAWKGKGFVDWKPFKHPQLGDVEVGGFVPFLKLVPPPEDIQKTIDFHTAFYLKLMSKLPGLEVARTEVKPLGPEFYQLTAYFTNPGWFPTSTAQGRRSRTAWPITVRLKLSAGQSLFSGRAIESIPYLDGSGDTKKIEWTIRAKKGTGVTVTAATPKLGTAAATVILE
ncbi:MAG: M14 family metallopeptidase [Acidobacteriota bacterium]